MRRLLDGFPFCVHFAVPKTSPTVNLAPDTARWTRHSGRTRRRALTIELLEGRALLSTLPLVITGAATSVSTVGATLHASVYPEGSTTTVRFQYSTEPWFSPTLESAVRSEFSQPKGVAVDVHGDVIVADWGKNAVTEVKPDDTSPSIGPGFGGPEGVAVDTVGDVFVAALGNSTITEILPDNTTRPIGSGFSHPFGVAVDAAGDVYVADTDHSAVKEVLPDGTILPVGAGFDKPSGVAVDAAGDVFVADTGNNAVKEVLPDGTILTIGSGFFKPTGVAVDAAGDVFVADTGNNALKEVLPNGTVVTIRTGLSAPTGVAADGAGDVFVADSETDKNNPVPVFELSPPTIAAEPSPLMGSTVTPVAARVTVPNPGTTYYDRAIAITAEGTVADLQSPPQSFTTLTPTPPLVATNAAVSVSTNGATLSASVNAQGLPTTVLFQYSPDPSFTPTVPTPLGSGFSNPTGVAVDAAGNVFVADAVANTVTEVPSYDTTTTVSIGSGFSNPFGMAVDAAGDVFVADWGDSAITEFKRDGISLPIGHGFSDPEGVAVDTAGDLFVADTGNDAVKEVLPDGTILPIGSGFSLPQAVAVDAAGDVFVADSRNKAIKEVLPNGHIVSIGSGFSNPSGVAVDAAGGVFVADTGNNAIKEVLPNGHIVSIGSGFKQPFGVAVDAADDVFVADYNNHRVVELSSPTVAATPSRLLGSTKEAVASAVTGLKPGTTYYDRVLASTDKGTVVDVKSPPQSFTTKATTSVRATGPTVKSSMTALGIGSGFSVPTGVAVDAAGDVFVADTGKNAIKEILPNGTIKTIGSHFKAPSGVAVDAAGDVFVADTGHNAVKEVLPNGTILTIGSRFSQPRGVAVDTAGDVFVADTGHNAVKEVLPNGTILTIGFRFKKPMGVAVDAPGDVFVADSGNRAVKEVLPNGTIKSIGSGFSDPRGVAVDAAGNVFVAAYGKNAVKKVLPDGTIQNIGAGFSGPTGVAVDESGDVFVASSHGNRVVTILQMGVPTVSRRKSRFLAMALMLWIGFGVPGKADAGSVLETPAGLKPGDQFRIVFATDGTNMATSTTITDYDKFVTTQAQGATYNGQTVQWLAIASLDFTNAIDHIGQSDTPVYLSNGTQVTTSTTTSGLWSGALESPIYTDLNGQLVHGQVWTGTTADGVAVPGEALGDINAVVGSTSEISAGWIEADVDSFLSPHSLYGISQVLTVTLTQQPVPEPSSIVMLGTALLAAAYTRRSRTSQRSPCAVGAEIEATRSRMRFSRGSIESSLARLTSSPGSSSE